MRRLALLAVVAACHHPVPSPAQPAPYALVVEPADAAVAADVRVEADGAIARIEGFFGAPFVRPFLLWVFGDRARLDAHWGAAWHQPDLHTECWMIGMGLADELSILSPTAWKAEACDHDPAKPSELRGLIAHELVHTYHQQRNPTVATDDAAAEAIAWFVEGLAVFVSGQLDDGHLAPARDAIASGAAPTRLADAWSGTYRYGVSGSLVAYVDATWGRAVLIELLAATTPDQILARLGVDEATLLARWQVWVTRE